MSKMLTRWRGERRLRQSFVWAVDGQRGSQLHSMKKVMVNDWGMESWDEWLDETGMLCIFNCKLLCCGSGRIMCVCVNYKPI